MRRAAMLIAVSLLGAGPARAAAPQGDTSLPTPAGFRALRAAIEDLSDTFPGRYRGGREYLVRLTRLEKARGMAGPERERRFLELRREALLANPLLDFDRLLVVRRRIRKDSYRELGVPANGSSNSEMRSRRMENDIAVLTPVGPEGALRTLHRPREGGYVGEVDLHWDADRLIFSRSNLKHFEIWEMKSNGAGARRVSRAPDHVDCYDACYLPDGRIVCGSTASYQSVPCFHGIMPACHLYQMKTDGTEMRQLCFDQDLDVHATVLASGQVLYNRWDYTGINHIFMRQLMVMNPDGSGQRAIYGSNSWFPPALYFPRAIPGRPTQLACILSGYHGAPRVGQLVMVDTSKGWHEADGIVKRISGRGDPVRVAVKDRLVDGDWPKFVHPWPLADPATGRGAGKYFLVSCLPDRKGLWGIYLADVFDNVVLVREEPGHALVEPVPVVKTPRPPTIPDRVDLKRTDGVVYLNDIYGGPGLTGVPRGTVKALRVIAYHFGYRGLAGPDKIGYGGPWEAMRILGTVPVEDDGSAVFRVPANTPIALQPMDAEGAAVQLMRSWLTVMPGETLSCMGCHEAPGDATPVRTTIAARKRPSEIQPWRGPPRGFSFAREVQPVLDRYCVSCHDGTHDGRPGLRSADKAEKLTAWPLGYVNRLDKKMLKDTGGKARFSPAYDALVRRIRRVSIEDDVAMLLPGEYHVDTSPLVQMLRKGHKGVRLDGEAWDRLFTWIDLNAPYHGTWSEVYPVPKGAHERRMELRRLYGGPADDPEAIPRGPRPRLEPAKPKRIEAAHRVSVDGWPFGAGEARRRQNGAPMTIDLGGGVAMKLVHIPVRAFVMGDPDGEPDERPLVGFRIARPFWIGACEVTNEQFHRFDPEHDCTYYVKRYPREDGKGAPLSGPRQPVVRVSWGRAMEFCQWLSKRTGKRFTLPTESQWEYACRAGTASALSYGEVSADFSGHANVGDRTFSRGLQKGGRQVTGGLPHVLLEGADMADARFDDRCAVTADVARFTPNAWGLHDMHGNASEWTLSVYMPYPYRESDGRNDVARDGPRVVRGGSFFDPPRRCRSGFRLAYPAWRRVFNVGFRIVCPAGE